MNAARRAPADELYASGRAHDAAQADRVARWRNVEPETAELLGVLVRAMGARRVLEIGTSNGYSTLWLADAAEAVGGSVVSLEVLAERTALAAEHLARAGLSAAADLRTVDAGGYWSDLVRVLAQPGLLVVDNVISHADQVADLRALVEADERVTSSLASIGAGVLLVARPGSR